MGVVGALEWGDKLSEQLVEAKLVREPADLYRLEWKQIAGLDRRGEKSAKKCLAELSSRLPLTLPVFIAALGMDNFALQTARLLVSAGYDTIEKLLDARQQAARRHLRARRHQGGEHRAGPRGEEGRIQRLLEVGVVPVTPREEGPLSGLSFCFTGTSQKPRAELTALVEGKGGRVLASVTKELDYLVIADPASTSSKAVKARKLGTKLITEEGLDQLVAERQKG